MKRRKSQTRPKDPQYLFRTALITSPLPSCWRQQGFTALEGLLLLVILISSLRITAHFVKQQSQDTAATATARQLNTVSRQSYQWVLEHWQPLQQQFEQSQPLESLDLLPLLQLPQPLPTHNSHRQRYKIQLIQAANRWQLWVTTHDGDQIPVRSCLQISAQVGAIAGYLTQNQASAFIVKGWQGLWQLPWPSSLGTTPQAGRLATLQTIVLPQVTSSNQILSRKPLNLIAKSNQLDTDLQLNRHQITFKEPHQTSQLSSQQWLFSQGSPALQSIKLTAQGVTMENSLHWGESEQNTLRLHHFLFVLSTKQELMEASLFASVKKLTGYFNPSQATHTYLQLRAPQCASQIHRLWGKLPYHEHSPQANSPEKLKNFADSICQEKSGNQAAFGRLFLVGDSVITEPAALFICSKLLNGGVAAFQLNKIDGYQHRQGSSKADAPITTQPHAIRIKLPGVLSDDAKASDCLSLLRKISRHIVFFEQSSGIYSNLRNQCSVKVNIVHSKHNNKEKDNLYYQLKNNSPSKKFSDDTFNELFNIYCKPLSSIPPAVKTYTTYDEVKHLDPSFLVTQDRKHCAHQISYKSIYEKLHAITYSDKKFKTDYNQKKSKKLNNFIKEINNNFDNTDLFVKRIIMDSLVKLQQGHPQWFEQQNKRYPVILGVDLPKEIENTKQAEEILSFLIILLDKIGEKKQIFSTQENFISKTWDKITQKDREFYDSLKNDLSKIDNKNKDDFLKEFINFYNKIFSPDDNFFTTILNQLPSLLKSILSNDKIGKFIKSVKEITEFDPAIQEDIINLLLDVVETHYQNSSVIKIRYPASTGTP